MNKYKSQAIAVDFDGVIAEFSDGIEEFGKPIPGAKEAMAELLSARAPFFKSFSLGLSYSDQDLTPVVLHSFAIILFFKILFP